MEDKLQDDSGHAQGVDQVNIAGEKVKPDILEQANAPCDVAEPRAASPSQHSRSSPLLSELRTPKSNEQFISCPMSSQTSLQKNLASPAAVRPQGTATASHDLQDTPKLPYTRNLLACPRRFRPATGYEVRLPANMTPTRIYRSSFGHDARQMHNAAAALPESQSRILPIGELITSHGNRTYTLWANEQHKANTRISTQVVITNINSTTTFNSYQGVSRRSPLEVLEDFSSLLRSQVIALMSLNVVQDSFVAVVPTEKDWEELREGILHAAR